MRYRVGGTRWSKPGWRARMKLYFFNPLTPRPDRDYRIRPATWRDMGLFHSWGVSLNSRGMNGRLNYRKGTTLLYFTVAFGCGLFVFDLTRAKRCYSTTTASE